MKNPAQQLSIQVAKSIGVRHSHQHQAVKQLKCQWVFRDRSLFQAKVAGKPVQQGFLDFWVLTEWSTTGQLSLIVATQTIFLIFLFQMHGLIQRVVDMELTKYMWFKRTQKSLPAAC